MINNLIYTLLWISCSPVLVQLEDHVNWNSTDGFVLELSSEHDTSVEFSSSNIKWIIDCVKLSSVCYARDSKNSPLFRTTNSGGLQIYQPPSDVQGHYKVFSTYSNDFKLNVYVGSVGAKTEPTSVHADNSYHIQTITLVVLGIQCILLVAMCIILRKRVVATCRSAITCRESGKDADNFNGCDQPSCAAVPKEIAEEIADETEMPMMNIMERADSVQGHSRAWIEDSVLGHSHQLDQFMKALQLTAELAKRRAESEKDDFSGDVDSD